MKRNNSKQDMQPGNKVGASCGWARSRTSYVQFSGVVAGIVGSLIGYTLFDVLGALLGGLLGIMACEVTARMVRQPR